MSQMTSLLKALKHCEKVSVLVATATVAVRNAQAPVGSGASTSPARGACSPCLSGCESREVSERGAGSRQHGGPVSNLVCGCSHGRSSLTLGIVCIILPAPSSAFYQCSST